MKIVIVPSTLRAGARRCLTVAREAHASAQRVGAMPAPDGMPPDALGQLRAAVAQLQRSAACAERESAFLQARAQRGLLADGPFGSLLDLAGPQLASPWALPASPPRKNEDEHHWWDGPVNFGLGAVDEVADTVKGLSDTGVGLAGHVIDGDVPGVPGLGLPGVHPLGRLSDHVPYMNRRRRELDEAADWARHHPGQFATAVGKDFIAYDDHHAGEHAHGAGRNAVGILTLLVPFSKAGAAGKATKAAGAARTAEEAAGETSAAARAAQRAAHVDHVRATVRQPGESRAAYDLRRLHAQNELTRTTGQAHLAEERLNTKVQEAHAAAERAAQARHEALEEAAGVPRDAAAKVLGNHDQAEP